MCATVDSANESGRISVGCVIQFSLHVCSRFAVAASLRYSVVCFISI